MYVQNLTSVEYVGYMYELSVILTDRRRPEKTTFCTVVQYILVNS